MWIHIFLPFEIDPLDLWYPQGGTALPRKVWTPMAMTTALISPCLHVEPEYTLSPGPLLTGRDSSVRADCNVQIERTWIKQLNFTKSIQNIQRL